MTFDPCQDRGRNLVEELTPKMGEAEWVARCSTISTRLVSLDRRI